MDTARFLEKSEIPADFEKNQKIDFAYMYVAICCHHIATLFSNICCCAPPAEISVEISAFVEFYTHLKFLKIFKNEMLLKTTFVAEFQQHLLFLATMLLK